MHKVLVVEDEREFHEVWTAKLGGKIKIVSAYTVQQAQEQYERNPDISAIVMDACVPGDRPTTIPLVRSFRKTFKGPMIASSGDPCFRRMLMEVGCDYESPKDSLPKKLLAVLGM